LRAQDRHRYFRGEFISGERRTAIPTSQKRRCAYAHNRHVNGAAGALCEYPALAPKPGRNGYRHTGSVTLINNSLNIAPPRDFISSLVRIIENDSGLWDGNERVSSKRPTSNPEFGFAEFAR